MAITGPMVPSPVCFDNNTEKAPYAALAMKKFLPDLKRSMQLGGLNVGTRRVVFDNGVIVTVNICFNREVVDVYVPPKAVESKTIVSNVISGFAIHPRSSLYPVGVNTKVRDSNGNVTASTNPDVMFPLYDGDFGTYLLSVNKEKNKLSPYNPDNYGILCWVSKSRSITWRGWAAITLAASRETGVDGLTQLDVQTAYNTYYTPLAGYLYERGSRSAAPGRVRGAGVSADGHTMVVSTVNYTQYDAVGDSSVTVNPFGQDWLYDNPSEKITEENKAGKVGGYYDELYVRSSGVFIVNGRVSKSVSVQGVEWIRIGYAISLISNLSVWFAQEVNSAICDEGEWSWNYSSINQVNGLYPEVTLPDGSKARPQGRFTSTFTSRETVQKKYRVAPGITTSISNEDNQDQRVFNFTRWSKTSNASWYTCYMQTKNAQLKTILSIGGTGIIGTDNRDSSTVPVKYQERPDPVGYYIDVYRPPYAGQPILLIPTNFKSGPYSWEGATVSPDTASATISYDEYITGSGIRTVTVTDKCGFTASVGVRMSNGYWCGALGYNYFCTDGCAPRVGIPCHGCNSGVGLFNAWWTDDRPDDDDMTQTTYTEQKWIPGGWCGITSPTVVCTIVRTWVSNIGNCSPMGDTGE